MDFSGRVEQGSKVCLAKYNIKKLHTRNMMPFFSESSGQKISKLKEIQKLGLDKPFVLPTDSMAAKDNNNSSMDKLSQVRNQKN